MSDNPGSNTLTHLQWRDLEQQGVKSGPPQEPDASKKLPAGICGIVLGAFGVHKFLLGYTKQGVIMLLVTVLTFGILGSVMAIVGLIEGILYLTKSDEDFARIYISGRKPWF